MFAREKSRGLFWFKLIDLTGTRGVIWEHEFYRGEFEYFKDREYFHSFAGDVSSVPFALCDQRAQGLWSWPGSKASST